MSELRPCGFDLLAVRTGVSVYHDKHIVTPRENVLGKIHTWSVTVTIYIRSDPLDLAELHSFRLVYFKHKEIFLAVCIVSDEGSVNNYARLPV